MRRTLLAVSVLVACACAGVFAALALADDGTPTVTTATTGPADTTTTETTTTTSTTTTTPVVTIAPGVTIGGIRVGALAPADAAVAVEQAFAAPVTLRYGRTRIIVAPDLLGAHAGLDRALARAQTAAPNTALPLPVTVERGVVNAFLGRLSKRFDREPVDSRLLLRKLRPVVTRAKVGHRLDTRRAAAAIVAALTANRRVPVALQGKTLKPKVTPKSFSSVVVIRRATNVLSLYHGMRLVKQFGVATGQTIYPTPLGRFQIVVKWKNPWWYPPASPWAKGEKPVPPGPGNPLGTRWMGISSPGVGIHGTPEDGSIGYSLSHGCIRMHIPQAEWLFEHVDVGTPVFIVSA